MLTLALSLSSPITPPAPTSDPHTRTRQSPTARFSLAHERNRQIEASWKTLSPAEQEATFKSLEELQKKPWTELTLDEKKACTSRSRAPPEGARRLTRPAAYYVAFGPHGPREPILPPGSGAKTFGGVLVAIAVAGGLFGIVRSFGQSPARPPRAARTPRTDPRVPTRHSPL